MITVYALDSCKNRIEMKFKNEESARETFWCLRLGEKISVKDDVGILHKGIDTFYGFTKSERNDGE